MCFSDGVTSHFVDLVSHICLELFLWRWCALGFISFVRELSWWALFVHAAVFWKASLLVLRGQSRHTRTQVTCRAVLLRTSLPQRKRWVRTSTQFLGGRCFWELRCHGVSAGCVSLCLRDTAASGLRWRSKLTISLDGDAASAAAVAAPWSVLGAIQLELIVSALLFVKSDCKRKAINVSNYSIECCSYLDYFKTSNVAWKWIHYAICHL